MNRRAVGRRALERHGYDVTRKTYEKTGEDEHGDAQYDITETTVKAYVMFNSVNAPDTIVGPQGTDFTVDVQIFVKDDLDITSLERGKHPDRFIVSGETYQVIRKQNQHNGVISCVSSRG